MSTSPFKLLNRPSVVTLRPSLLRMVMSTLASNAVAYAFGLQTTSKNSSPWLLCPSPSARQNTVADTNAVYALYDAL